MTMKTWIIGNWKSNPASLDEAINLVTKITNKVSQDKERDNLDDKSQLVLIPSTLHLASVKGSLLDGNILLGSQDVSVKSSTTGAFTGDSCAQQLADLGISWSLVGHSERREYYDETDNILVQKIENLLTQDIGAVFCIGESLEQYENDETIAVLKTQLEALKSVKSLAHSTDKLIVAYEPIWAIGTGKVPTVAEVEAVHKKINQALIAINPELSEVPIIYGGSVNPTNAPDFAKSQWINGALIGGASLVADKFLSISEAFEEVKNA